MFAAGALVFGTEPKFLLVFLVWAVLSLFWFRTKLLVVWLLGNALGIFLLVVVGAYFFSHLGDSHNFSPTSQNFSQQMGLVFPVSTTNIQMNQGGFQDTVIFARLEMKRQELPNFLANNALIKDENKTISNANLAEKWWKPDDMPWLGSYKAKSKDTNELGKTSTGFDLHLQVHELKPDWVDIYIYAVK